MESLKYRAYDRTCEVHLMDGRCAVWLSEGPEKSATANLKTFRHVGWPKNVTRLRLLRNAHKGTKQTRVVFAIQSDRCAWWVWRWTVCDGSSITPTKETTQRSPSSQLMEVTIASC